MMLVRVRLSEHYNRYGAIFCHTVFNKKGQKALRKFKDVTGREMIGGKLRHR